jgi:Family of unknown function (DUF5670)
MPLKKLPHGHRGHSSATHAQSLPWKEGDLTEQGSVWTVTRPFRDSRRGKPLMLLTIAIILLILWALGFFAFHVAGGLIHILLIIGIIVLIWNFVAGRRTV